MATLFFYTAMASAAIFFLATAAPPMISMEMDQVNVKPVNMTVYYETLCPGCNYYLTQSLGPVWHKIKDLNLMTVNLLPFGNAQERKIGFGYEFTCQHGADECLGNIVETCLIHYYSDTTTHLEMVVCFNNDFFNSEGADWQQSLQNCKSTGFDMDQIKKCVNGREGNDLEHIMAQNTGPHKYTPFIMLDGVEDIDAETNLLKEVCKVYKGKKPDICFE